MTTLDREHGENKAMTTKRKTKTINRNHSQHHIWRHGLHEENNNNLQCTWQTILVTEHTSEHVKKLNIIPRESK